MVRKTVKLRLSSPPPPPPPPKGTNFVLLRIHHRQVYRWRASDCCHLVLVVSEFAIVRRSDVTEGRLFCCRHRRLGSRNRPRGARPTRGSWSRTHTKSGHEECVLGMRPNLHYEPQRQAVIYPHPRALPGCRDTRGSRKLGKVSPFVVKEHLCSGGKPSS